MPKLNINIGRTRDTLEYTPCAVCGTRTFEIDQNKCIACASYLCFGCAALKRTYCCEGYVKQFWPGTMKEECARLQRAMESGDGKRIRRAMKNFGTDDITKITAEIERYQRVTTRNV